MFLTLASKVALLLTLAFLSGGFGTWLTRKADNVGLIIGMLIWSFVGIFVTFGLFHVGPVPGAISLCIWSCAVGGMAGPAISRYREELGDATVIRAFLGTAGVGAVCGAIATFSGVNFGGLGGILCIALWVLIIAGIIRMFVGMGTQGNIFWSLAGMVVFSGYFLFDFWRLAHKSENSWQSAGELTMSLYLDFWNFFLDLLQFLAAIQDKKHAMLQGAGETLYAMVSAMPDTLHNGMAFAGHAMTAAGLC